MAKAFRFSPCIVRGVLSASECATIEGYALLTEHRDFHADRQVPGAHAVASDALTDACLLRLRSRVEAIVADLCPTYSYLRVYRSGAVLHPHADRPACEVSASICIARPHGRLWPLRFEDQCIVNLSAGDMVVYPGALLHWREPAPFTDGYQVQMFLHYVRRHGPHYPDQAWDGKPGRFPDTMREPCTART